MSGRNAKNPQWRQLHTCTRTRSCSASHGAFVWRFGTVRGSSGRSRGPPDTAWVGLGTKCGELWDKGVGAEAAGAQSGSIEVSRFPRSGQSERENLDICPQTQISSRNLMCPHSRYGSRGRQRREMVRI